MRYELAVLAGGADRMRITRLQNDIRAGMARHEIVAAEAPQERQTYLTDEFDPDPLVRTVFRLRIGRAATEPFKSRRPHRPSYARALTRCPIASIRLCLMQSSKGSQNSPRLSRNCGVRAPRGHYRLRTSAACTPWDFPLSSFARISKIFVTASSNAPGRQNSAK
jgi:hypothetical protein